MPSQFVLSVCEAAERLRCSNRQVWKLLQRKELRRAKSFGRETMITASSVEALERRYYGPPPGTREQTTAVNAQSVALPPAEMKAAVAAIKAKLFPSRRSR